MIKNDDPILWDFWQDKVDSDREFQSGFAEAAIRQYHGLWEFLSMEQEQHGQTVSKKNPAIRQSEI